MNISYDKINMIHAMIVVGLIISLWLAIYMHYVDLSGIIAGGLIGYLGNCIVRPLSANTGTGKSGTASKENMD